MGPSLVQQSCTVAHLFWEVLILQVDEKQRPVAPRVEAREGRPQDLDKVPVSPQGVPEPVVVGVQVVGMPVQDVVGNVQGVPGDVPGGVPHIVELVE